ncbi:hypothetical protein AGMMS50225_29000 [Betaproteobacteria bacterium]|nr:hypothetical protein AGMMS50225_29000 [Betaproteobacteria bacterium]
MIDIKNNKQSENFSYFPENKVRFILKDVINIPENFFKYREGFVIIPAVFRLSNLIASKECDAYHFSAAFIDINEISNVLPEQEDALSKLPVSCNSAPYDETFFVEAKIAESSSERIEVRSLPNIASDISAHLENGTIVLKVRTVDDNWVYIKAIPGDTPYSTDAKKPVVFGYLYKPIVIFLPVN